MVSQQRIFFDFLQFCISSVADIPASVKDADWKVLYVIAKKQALIGVLFYGIRRLPKELAPEQKLLMQWMVMAEQIRKQNIRLFQDSVKVCQNFENEGFANCILKGQGNALLYPDPYMRTPGDIDIYLTGGRKRVMQYINKVCPNQVMRYHHVDFPVMKTAIEAHFTPSYMFFPVHNRRMQKWFEEVMGEQCNHRGSLPDGYGEIHVPQVSFNVIYILSHLYRHIFTEGIGLRQLLDYYFVICDFHKVYQNSSNHPVPLSKEGSTFSPSPSSSGSGDVTAPSRCSEPLRSKDGGPSKVSPDCAVWDRQNVSGDTSSVSCSSASGSSITSVRSASTTDSSASTALVVVQRELKYLGLWKFAGAVMYVLKEVLGLSEDKMIVPMDEKRGRLLLAEILDGGNFGRHFTKYARFTHQSMGKKYFLKIWRNMHFVRYYPAEVLSEPLFRTWHFFWRMKNKK